MKRVILSLISEHTNLNEEPLTLETLVHKKYDYLSSRITNDVLKDLFDSIRSIREDWVSFKVVSDKYNIYAEVTLLSMSEENNDFIIPYKILELVDQFFKQEEIQNIFPQNNNYTSINEKVVKNDYIENTQGILIEFKGQVSSDELDFLKILEKEDIEYEVVSHSFLTTDMGASSAMMEVIIFISNAAVGGIAWDIMKAKLEEVKSKITSSTQMDVQQADDIAFGKMKESVSNRTNIHVNNLTLVSTNPDETIIDLKESERFFRFLTNNSFIEVKCDEQYVIRDLEIKNL